MRHLDGPLSIYSTRSNRYGMLVIVMLALRRADVCSACEAALPAGTRAAWQVGTRTLSCLNSLGTFSASSASAPPMAAFAAAAPTPAGPAGTSSVVHLPRPSGARRCIGAARVREVLPAARAEPSLKPSQSRANPGIEQRAGQYARLGPRRPGERTAAAKLGELAGDHVEVLHDRAVPGEDGHKVDHLAVVANGVWVSNAKTHQRSPRCRIPGPRLDGARCESRQAGCRRALNRSGRTTASGCWTCSDPLRDRRRSGHRVTAMSAMGRGGALCRGQPSKLCR